VSQWKENVLRQRDEVSHQMALLLRKIDERMGLVQGNCLLVALREIGSIYEVLILLGDSPMGTTVRGMHDVLQRCVSSLTESLTFPTAQLLQELRRDSTPTYEASHSSATKCEQRESAYPQG